MSIETKSVSNPVVRDSEISSKRNIWSKTQGSATGSKDGQFNSFWDKAFVGAQKLFGIDAAERSALSKSEDLETEEERRHDTELRSENRGLNSAPDFENRSLNRIATSIRRENSNELLSMMLADWSMDQRLERSAVDDDWYERRIMDIRADEDANRERIDVLEDDSESKDHTAKTAASLKLGPSDLTNFALKNKEENRQNVEGKGLRKTEILIGINSAMSNPNMSTNLATNYSEETASILPSPLENVEEISTVAARKVFSDGEKLIETGLENSKRVGEYRTPNDLNLKVGRDIEGDTKGVSGTRSRNNVASKDVDSLVIDFDKAKQNPTAVIETAKSANTSKVGQGVASGFTQSNLPGPLAHSSEVSVEKEAVNDLASKGADATRQSHARSQPNSSVQSDVTKPNLSSAFNSGQTASDINQLKRTEIRSISKVVGSPRPTANSGVIGLPSQSAPIASVAVSHQGNSETSHNQLKSPVDRSLGKQEVEAALKGTAPTKPTGTTSKADGAQGLQLAGSDVSVSSKPSFTAKAQPVSYASKSADETKEIYTALSKSVDKLASTKVDTVSIRINFDQGGSMALRVSMDSGHVSSAMQTDLFGLESLIKSSWSEFASEMNQKGVKLNPPQFTNFDSDSFKNEQFMNFDQKGGSAKGGHQSEAKSNGGRRSDHSNQQQSDSLNSESSESVSGDKLDSEQELQTYA